MTQKEETLTGWLTRNEYGWEGFYDTRYTLLLHSEHPERHDSEHLGGYWESDSDVVELPWSMFPELTWKDEPVYVKLTIEVLQ